MTVTTFPMDYPSSATVRYQQWRVKVTDVTEVTDLPGSPRRWPKEHKPGNKIIRVGMDITNGGPEGKRPWASFEVYLATKITSPYHRFFVKDGGEEVQYVDAVVTTGKTKAVALYFSVPGEASTKEMRVLVRGRGVAFSQGITLNDI